MRYRHLLVTIRALSGGKDEKINFTLSLPNSLLKGVEIIAIKKETLFVNC